jgi:hypothetical protein
VSAATIAKFFLSQAHPSFQAFREFLGSPAAAQHAWSVLVQNNCLRLERQVATKTPAFVRLLQRYLD